MKMRLLLPAVVIGFMFLGGCTSGGVVELGTENPETPVANEGYDSVAYFASDTAAKGSAEFAYFWKGAKWLFSNRENLEKFKSDPASFAPQFGSYCPVSLANGGKDQGNPRYWTVFEHKLYFFNNESFRDQFEKDPAAVLGKAKSNYKDEAN
ncbi:MAG: hypothetical protein OEM82_03400 [Acidobacteriota bacterium]|nr:hypothetical protein [Acidobacteriota bacterium]